MKLALDDSIPARLTSAFGHGFEAHTVNSMGWNAASDKTLIQLMKAKAFKALITAAKEPGFQKELENQRIIMVSLISGDNRYETLLPYVPMIEKELQSRTGFDSIDIRMP